MEKKHFATKAIHGGYDPNEMKGSVSVPLFQTASFRFKSAEHGEKSFLGEEDGFIYTRIGNPTINVLEERIAELESAESGIAFSSGMGAISAVLIALTKANDHILASKGLYGSSFSLLKMFQEKYNISFSLSDFESEAEIRSHIKPETSVIYIETPINPTMKLIDLELVSRVAKEHDIPVVVDNTFSSPYIQRPIEHGCDIVVHSATKYINGHGDVIAGLAVGKKEWIDEIRATTLKDIGSVISPFDAWLMLRGLKTLPVRMDRHSDNAEYIVERLLEHPQVENVYYPTLDQSGIFEKQMARGGGVIAFELKGDKKTAQKLLNNISFINVAVSLGDTETLIEHPATMTHVVIPEEERRKMGISDTLIRLSVGLEDVRDIWSDLEAALNKL